MAQGVVLFSRLLCYSIVDPKNQRSSFNPQSNAADNSPKIQV
ncbi:hypothetical protein D931_04020 [Enterococcus faecium 13.SD.W.09]|nr:hypothetical protein D931_04020 [Enterococcus faecium 13.SD.W.09]